MSQIVPSVKHTGHRAGSFVGIGDDAAVLCPSPNSDWVISCDFSLEGTHFRSNYPPNSVGYKSLARATSDLAAMGARPRYFLLALALPASKTSKWLRQFASGMSRAAREFDSKLIGGDVSKSTHVTVCVTVLGEIPVGVSVLRSGAKPGDLIYVSGTLGAAQLGLEIVLRGLSRRSSLQKYLQAHLYPRIPIRLGESLAHKRIPSAMMDISDGLSTDLVRLCAASGVGAEIHAESLPLVKVPTALLRGGVDPLALALHGGDDYGLLFTISPKSVHLLRRIKTSPQVTHIGEITRGGNITLIRPEGHSVPLLSNGWDPFRR